MISVDLDKIVTAKGLQSHLASILYEVEEEEKIYIVTKQGKPQAAIVNVDYLMELTGQKSLPTKEYDRYDQAPPVETPAPAPAVAPVDTPTLRPIEPAPTEIVEPPAPASPAATSVTEAPTPPPVQITDLEQLADAPEPAADEDPYAVADEQQIDLNGLPIKGQPDLSDRLANAPTNAAPNQSV